MTARPLILGDNLFETTLLHPTYALSNPNNDDAAGREMFRLADNLRDLTWWTVTTTNATRAAQVDTQSTTAAAPDTVILDRGHNLAGEAFSVFASNDPTFGTGVTTLTTATIPTTPGGLPTDASGCLTPEGVWWKRFTAVPGLRYQRIQVAAMGAGLAPIVTGAYLGTAYRFPEYLEAGHAYDYRQKLVHLKNATSQGGVRVKTKPVLYDLFGVNISSMLDSDFTAFQTEMNRLLRYGQPWWICLDDSTTTGAGLMRLFQPPGDLEYEPVLDPIHRRIQFEMESVIPALYR